MPLTPYWTISWTADGRIGLAHRSAAGQGFLGVLLRRRYGRTEPWSAGRVPFGVDRDKDVEVTAYEGVLSTSPSSASRRRSPRDGSTSITS